MTAQPRKCPKCKKPMNTVRSDAKQCRECRRKQQNEKSHEIKKEKRRKVKNQKEKEKRSNFIRKNFDDIEEKSEKHNLEKIRDKMRAIPCYMPTLKEREILERAIYPEGFNYFIEKDFDKKELMSKKLIEEIGFTQEDIDNIVDNFKKQQAFSS